MYLISDSLNRIEHLLLDPVEQKPNVKLKLDALIREFQNFYNELSNSSIPWTKDDFSVMVSGSQTDYLVSGGENAGKILMVFDSNSNSLQFVDLYDASLYWWGYTPIIAARPEDYNFAQVSDRIAFYRKNGSLYAKVPSALSTTLTITAATGAWAENVALGDSPVLREYHHLPEIRAARVLVPGAEWTTDANRNREMRQDLVTSLRDQETRVYDDFIIAKRTMTAGQDMYRTTNDAYFD